MRLPFVRSALRAFLFGVVLDSRRGPVLALCLFVATAISAALTGGPRLAVAVMAILLAHEMGHFVACRVHGVASTWPYFLPAPYVNPFGGTLGAVMAIRERFPNRRVLFDIGVAGPLAGMVVCLAVLPMAVREIPSFTVTSAAPVSPDTESYGIGTPLLWKVIDAVLPSGSITNLGPDGSPLATALWFGLLLTGLNLIPIGQFDGGHILYALFPRRAHRLAYAAWWICLGLSILGPNWLVWALLTKKLGRRHPPTLDDSIGLGRTRAFVAVLALIAFVVSFIPEPILDSWPMLLEDLKALGHAAGILG